MGQENNHHGDQVMKSTRTREITGIIMGCHPKFYCGCELISFDFLHILGCDGTIYIDNIFRKS